MGGQVRIPVACGRHEIDARRQHQMVVGQDLVACGGADRQCVARRVDGDCAALHHGYAMVGFQGIETQRDPAHRQRAGDNQVGEDAGNVLVYSCR
jgi:hypothetical protein